MSEANLLISTHDGVREITLNRPEKKNALDGQLFSALAEAMQQARQDDDVHVVMLMGAGGNFCNRAVGKLVSLHWCWDLFHSVHIDGHSVTGTKLALCVFAPSINNPIAGQRQCKGFATSDLGDRFAG